MAGHIDTYTKSKPFQDMSYSSKEDVFKILWMFDTIEREKNKLNIDALAIYVDIMELTKGLEFLTEYIYIQLGRTPMSVEDHGKEISEVIAERRGIGKDECDREISKEIDIVVERNKQGWIESVLNQEIYHYPKKVGAKREYFSDEKNKKIDFEIKHGRLAEEQVGKEKEWYPESLQNVIDAQKENENRMSELRSIKERNEEERKELNRRIKYDIRLFNDIQELKRHYGYEYAQESIREGSYSFNEDIDIEDDFELDEALGEWEVESIKVMAEEVLTDRQFIVFNLYYIVGMTQQEIADILSSYKSNINRDIVNIISKLKENSDN